MISPTEPTKRVPLPCDFCTGGYDAAESVRLDLTLDHSSILREGEKPVSEFGFNCSRFMRLWYPPLRRTQGWGTHGCGEFTIQNAGHPSTPASVPHDSLATMQKDGWPGVLMSDDRQLWVPRPSGSLRRAGIPDAERGWFSSTHAIRPRNEIAVQPTFTCTAPVSPRR